jgi:phage repressor protein C with HTH and peptisase S24 domain
LHKWGRMSTTVGDADFRGRLSEILRGYRSVGELAQRIGVSDNAIYKWLAGRGQPSVANLVALARAGKVSVEWLATGREASIGRRAATKAAADHGDYTFVPRYDVRIADDHGATLRSEQVVDYLAFKTEWVYRRLNAQPRNLLLIEAIGDSMAPTIRDSDLLLVDLGEPRFKQDGIYVLRRGDDLIVKRLQPRHDGELIIRSDNPAYEPTIAPRENLGIIGRVIWVAARL